MHFCRIESTAIVPNKISFQEGDASKGARTKLVVFATAVGKLPELAGRRYCVERGALNEVAITRNGHVLGIWRVANGCYLYTPMGHSRPAFSCRELSVAIRQVQKLSI